MYPEYIEITPIGVDGQAVLYINTFPSSGLPGQAASVVVSGLPSGNSVTLTSTNPAALVTGFTNGVSTRLYFTPCNAEQCNTAGRAERWVTTYGPLSSATFPSPGVYHGAGTVVCAVFTAHGNGAEARLEVTSSVGGLLEVTGSLQLSPGPLCVDSGAPGTPVLFTALVTDTSGNGRATPGITTQLLTSQYPTQTVTVVSGTQTTPECPGCFNIRMTFSGFTAPVLCTFSYSGTTPAYFPFTHGNGTLDTYQNALGLQQFYGPGLLDLQCGDVRVIRTLP
jgi:hypothetical protein